MPLQLLSRPTPDTVRSRSPSPLTTPASKPQIPTIRLTAATPCNTNPANDISRVAPWITSEATPVPIAPKPTTNRETSRKRLVPKKSKLSLLVSSSAKPREQDFADEARQARVDDESNGFEIHVDPANDPDIGDILVVKKKKSRLGLDGLQWGTLGEVTNVPSVTKPKEKARKETQLKVKVDENQKWWSIGRGRKESKEKDKGKDKDGAVKAPLPVEKPADARARFNSLDSGILLASPVNAEHPKPPMETLRVPTPPSVTLAPPSSTGLGSGKGSVAIRAMRSVRSLARISSWAQLKNTPNPDPSPAVMVLARDKGSDGKKKKKKKDKEKEKDKAKEMNRYSGSSFEAGALSASPAGSKHESRSLCKRKPSILGLGLPSTIRLPSSRSGSTSSSIVAANTVNRLSVDSANLLGGGILAQGRSGSTMSTASSLRPISAKSRQSSGSSGAASVRWDETGLRTMKEIRQKDKESRRKEKEESTEKKKSKKLRSVRDPTRKLSDGRKRTPLAAIFPGTASEREEDQPPTTPIRVAIIEGATADGHEHQAETVFPPTGTPMKHVRHRPVSEQPLGRSRPKPFCEGDDDNAVMTLLDAATNDLAQLINRLDLEATPGSVEVTPISQRSPFLLDPSSLPTNRLVTESPVKDFRRKNSSMTSLRPYAQSCSNSTSVQLGQNIAPWSVLNAGISPSKSSLSTIRVAPQDNMATIRTHGRTLTPAPAADPSPIFKALRPATTRLPVSKKVVSASSGVSPFVINPVDRSPSALTFGSGHSKSESRGSLAASPVFKKAQGHTRKSSSVAQHKGLDSHSLPILPEARRNLGLAGTMGGSINSIAEQDYDGSDPDSDIPNELQAILSNSDQEGEDTISFHYQPALPSPGLPPELPLPELDSPSLRCSLAEIPVFQATVIDEDENHADIEESGALSEDDTKKSFDFTGELQKLNESGASDRRSFIEQLENAFRTPAKIDLRHDFGDLPPVPKLPTLQDELSCAGESSFNLPIDYVSRELSPRGFPVDANLEPSLLPGSDSFATTMSDEELLNAIAPQISQNATPVVSRPSNGELNRDFKFGGKQSSPKKESSPLTLSDVIPPPEIARSLSMASFAGDESSLMKSILAHAIEIQSPPECHGLDLDSDSKREAHNAFRNSYAVIGRQRNNSALSFAGFDSFAEVRRGFEFHDNRPGFYHPPGATSDRRHRKHESIYSIASVSSYGNVLHGGSVDPFDYGSILPLSSLRERPSSDDFSFTTSSSVDDTFSFLRRQPLRRRVDSDASSFYFRPSLVHRTHRRPQSGVSVGPPISMFNRNSTHHRRGDSNASMNSVAQLYANCARFSWARHRSNFSVESVLSDLSAVNLARPGLGDKMLDSALERSTPLTSISASPPPSPTGSFHGEQVRSEDESRPLYDSIMDSQYQTQKTDSLFDKTSNRNSVCSSDSTFFEQDMENAAVKLPRYRPISSMSIPSVHSPPKEDDTMISMLGGGHVRRRSVTSMIGSSPCVQVERRKNILANPPETVFSRIQKAHQEDHGSPKVSRVIESKPSIASTTSSSQFGDERMIRAKHGLLERQSLENTVLIGDGEDLSGSFRMPVFTRPSHATRSRSSTCTSSSGAETPPLSISDGYSSFSEGSLSSIDLSQLNTLLSNTTHPLSNAAFDRARPPTRGHRRHRRISQARASRTSIYETIEEELNSSLSPMNSFDHSILGSTSNTVKLAEAAMKTADPPQVHVMDSETSSVDSLSLWDDERGITALRRYYALRDEAEGTITDSKRTWLDTPFSVFAIQSFDPPRHRSAMQAMLEHSLQNYGPLPSELRLRHVRSRVNSRPSPYPRTVKTSFTSSPSSEHLCATVAASLTTSADDDDITRHSPPLANALQKIMIDPNVPSTVSGESKDRGIPADKPERVFGLPLRPLVGSTARRVALGGSKKSTGRNGAENKENKVTTGNICIGGVTAANVSQGTMMTPADGLRLNRPRPRGRPTPAAARPIRA